VIALRFSDVAQACGLRPVVADAVAACDNGQGSPGRRAWAGIRRM